MAIKKKSTATRQPALNPTSTQARAEESSEVVQLNPALILPADNIRYGLKKDRVDRMMADILDNGIQSPIQVRNLTAEEKAANPTFDHKVVTGSIRHAAVLKANMENKAGLTIPAFVRGYADRKSEVIAQIRENNERENMSPMDVAKSIKEMLDQGFTKQDIRNAFPRPTGKGNKLAPASNSWINITASFNEFPAKIKDRIHDGRISFSAAADLFKKDRTQWESIITNIEEARLKAAEAEDKAEQKFLDKAREEEEKAQKESTTTQAIDEAQKLVDQSKVALDATQVAMDAAVKVASEAYTKSKIATGANKKPAQEEYTKLDAALASAKAEHTAAEKVWAKNVKALDKLVQAKTARDEAIAKRKAQIEAGRTAPAGTTDGAATGTPGGAPAPAASGSTTKGRGKSGAISKGEVNRQAAAQGAADKPVALNLKEAREIIRSIVILSDSTQSKTRTLGNLILEAFDGKLGDGADAKVHMGITKLLGEYFERAAPARKK